MKTKLFFIFALIIGIVSGTLASLIVLNIQPSKDDIMRDFYLAENYIHVSPHGLRKDMTEGDDSFIIVDLRSQEEYEKEHIIGAINIPAYRDPDNSAYDEVDRIVSMFKSLRDRNPEKDIIVYCYSIPCMTGRKIGKMLAEHGIYVKQLGIGWNEWRYYWELWNHEHEWNQTNVLDYIAKGSEPGTLKLETNSEICDIEGEFGC
jgi:rhodanese-related sulfurtransferase